MKIKFVYGILPVIIFYTSKFIRHGFDGQTRWFLIPYICIHPAWKYHDELLKHELTHVKQMYRGLIFLYYIRRWVSQAFIIACEREAYKAQGFDEPQIEEVLKQYN